MSVQAGQTYRATVTAAALTASSTKGTPGIAMTFETDEGDIDHVIWMTHKTAKRAKEDLEKLGADPSKLASVPYCESIGSVIVGRECEIVTGEDEYNGRKKVIVRWINTLGHHVPAADTGSVAAHLAYLFGGPDTRQSAPAPAPAEPKQQITDDDVPF